MSQVIINDVPPYTQASASGGQTVFGTNWTANFASDVVVYVTPVGTPPNDATQILNYPSQYSVDFIGDQQQVQVTLVNAANLGDIVTVTRMTPADRENLYSNTNFIPSMLNNDFGILTLVDQQAQLVDQKIGPRYNYSATIVDVVDTILPILEANQFWAKNSDNDEIIALTIADVIAGGTVTEVDTGLGLTGGPILVTGTVSMLPTLPGSIQLNITQLGALAQALNMNTHLINNVVDPVSAQDAATKNYVDVVIVSGFLPLSGGTMSGIIDMGNHKITSVTNPTSAQDAVTLSFLTTSLGDYLPLSGGTMSGLINMGSNKITSLTDPTSPQDAATKNYVDTVATGFTVQPAVSVATTVELVATYDNGASGIGATLTNADTLAALTIDSVSVNTNDRVLVKNQSSTLENGIYTVTNIGSGAVAWILTRATDYDQPSEITPGDLVIVNSGTTYASTSFIETASVAAVGTDPILFSQFTFSATAVLLKANNLSDVANATTSFNNISPLTTKGDLIGFSTQNIRVAVGGTNTQILQVDSAATAGFSWSTATYPATTTINQILYSSATNTVVGLATLAGGVLVTDSSSVPQFLTNPAAVGRILQSANAAIPTWSTATYPATSGTSGNVMTSDGTNWTSAVNTGPALLTTKGDLFGFSTVNARVPVATGDGKVLQVDSTATVGVSYSTATFPSTATGTGTLLRADGTNWSATTTTYPNTNAINTLLYASSANVMSALAPVNSAFLTTSSGGVPTWSTALPILSVKTQVFTSSGTYTPTTGMTYCIIEAWGGGGGGGGATNSSAAGANFGAGGGAGAYSRLLATAATIGASKTVTIAAGGAGGAAGANTGSPGGASSVTTLCVANGGAGGGSTNTPGGVGGVAGTGDITGTGATGFSGSVTTINQSSYLVGQGASSSIGGGGNTRITTGTGNAATGFAAGGAGGLSVVAGGTAAGGAGSSGYIIITEFI